ncbi:hypothetical protein VTL71DRAFT_15068 [Oculimacula yallundae]|uniref:Uncharacterized protein n=1 Tax=Oculimacula yallundae TaxID=86028 RepID=A0ABR4CFI9_9HELO
MPHFWRGCQIEISDRSLPHEPHEPHEPHTACSLQLAACTERDKPPIEHKTTYYPPDISHSALCAHLAQSLSFSINSVEQNMR